VAARFDARCANRFAGDRDLTAGARAWDAVHQNQPTDGALYLRPVRSHQCGRDALNTDAIASNADPIAANASAMASKIGAIARRVHPLAPAAFLSLYD
jgi:hypothetical protein